MRLSILMGVASVQINIWIVIEICCMASFGPKCMELPMDMDIPLRHGYSIYIHEGAIGMLGNLIFVF